MTTKEYWINIKNAKDDNGKLKYNLQTKFDSTLKRIYSNIAMTYIRDHFDAQSLLVNIDAFDTADRVVNNRMNFVRQFVESPKNGETDKFAEFRTKVQSLDVRSDLSKVSFVNIDPVRGFGTYIGQQTGYEAYAGITPIQIGLNGTDQPRLASLSVLVDPQGRYGSCGSSGTHSTIGTIKRSYNKKGNSDYAGMSIRMNDAEFQNLVNSQSNPTLKRSLKLSSKRSANGDIIVKLNPDVMTVFNSDNTIDNISVEIMSPMQCTDPLNCADHNVMSYTASGNSVAVHTNSSAGFLGYFNVWESVIKNGMEAMLLKAKKKYDPEKSTSIYRGASKRSKELVSTSLSGNLSASDIMDNQTMLDAFNKNREAQVKRWMQIFDDCGLKDYDRCHAEAIVSVECPGIYVQYSDGTHHVITLQQMKDPQTYAEQIAPLDGATIISVDALVLSFQEVSNKADRALLNFGQNVTDISDLRISMRNYMNDWSTWSTKIPSRNTNILTVEDCVGKIRGLRKYHKNIKATDDLQDPTTSLREKLFPGRPNVDVYATQELNRFVEKANEYNANASKNSSHSRDFISNFYQDCRKALDGFNGSVDDLIEKGFGFTNMSYVKDQKNKYDVGKSYNKSWSDKYIYNANNLFIKIDSLPGELREFEEQEIIQSIREALSNGRNIIVRDTYTSTIQNILLENDMIPSGIDIDHVVKVGGYAKFNISESIAEYGRAHNVIYIPAIHEVKADPFMMSTPNWKNAPDAGSKFRLSFFNDNNIVFGRHEKFGVNEKISSYFQQAVGNNYAFSLVKNTDELNGLAANSSNMTYLKYNTVSSKYNMNYLRSSVKDYLKYVKTHGFNSYMAGMSQGSCVGIVKREIPGEETIYAPIILVDDKFRGENNTIDFDIALCDNGQLAYSYSRIIQPMPGDQVKSNSVGTGNKHIGSFSTDNNEFSVVSCPFYKDGHIIPGHMFDRQSQTIDGKLKGMTKRNMWCNLQNGAIDAGLSIWIDPKTGKAKNTLSEDVVKLVDDLMQGQTKAYKKLLLISNFFNTSEPIDIEQTNAIKRAITLAQQWRVMEMNRFTSKCRLINGEIIKNDTTADYSPIYDIMSEHDLLLFFNAFDSRLCPRGIYDPCTNNHFFDHNGCVLYFNPTTEKYERVICHFEEPNMFDPGPGIQFSGRATMSDQAFVNNISAYGIHPEDMQRLLSIIAKHHGDIDYRNAAVRAANKQIKAEMLPIQRTPNNTAMDVYNKIIDRSTPATRMMYSRFIKTINTIAKHRVNIVENTKTNDPTPQAEIAKLTQKLNDAYRYSSTDPRCFTDDDTLKIFEQSIAWSYDEDGNANNWSISTMEESINKIVSRVRFTEEFVLPIQHLDSTCNRFANPILSRDVWQKILDSPKYQNQYDENYLHERLENEWEETNKYWQQQLNKSSDVAQLRAIEDNAIALMLNNGMYDVASTSITGYMSTAEWINYDNEMLDVINFSDPNLRQAWYEQQQHDFKQATRMKLAVMTIEQQRADNGPNSNAVSKKHPQTAATSMMYNMSALGKTMALINPELALGNGLDTLVKTGYSRNMIKMAELGVGPIVMDQKLDLDWNIIKTAARDHNFRRIMSIFKRSRVEGKGIVNASEYKSPTEFLKAINDAENKSVIEKVWDKTATFASAGDIFTTQEGENFISYVIIKAMQQGHTWLLEDSGVPVNNEPGARNMTMIEYQLSQDPGKWLFDLLKAENNADYIMGQQALNSALRGTMANRNLLSMIYEHLMDGHAATELLFTSCFCRFFQYSTNFTMNIMNWVAPMSSIHHLATRYVMTWGTNADGKRIKRWVLKDGTKRSEIAKGIAAEAETLLTESSLKEALMHDAIKMSTGIMAMAIFGLAAFEPPEDDEGNVDLQRIWNVEEWTIFGHRIQAAWWIQDTIGLALPMAAAMKASSLGYPNVKILTHGLQKAIAINPMVNIGELVKSIYDPTYQMPDYSYDLENNKSDRDAGGLDKMEWLADSGSALTLSWFSQFVTPSFLKEWYQAGQEFEASIKYVQATDAQGNPVVGADGNPIYERTTAHDRSLRALSKKNPIIGWFLDKIKDPAEGSGYMASEMPRTVYYDQVQREMMAKYSCYTTDENGETVLKEGADLQSSILQIIGELQSYEDMGELAETGFYLDYNTKAYMSKFIWDYINQLKDAYYDGYNYGEFSEWALGYGLYDYGKEKASEIQQSYWDEINYWKSFYYDKLWSSDLKKQMVEYNRQNTIYLQDADGNYYASGILNNKSPLLPFKVASDPDDITSNKDTSWATYSALTGQAMFDDNNNPTRALVPMQEDYYETPDLESWEGYDPSDPTSWQGDTSSSNSYGSGKSTGGGYYYSSGGSSYSPKIYSRNRNPYQKTSNVMQSSKPYKTNYDYLKPVVDKKGSKDPQRRSDF